MTGLMVLSMAGPTALCWVMGIAAAAGGVVLHLLHPPHAPDVAEAMLLASVHP